MYTFQTQALQQTFPKTAVDSFTSGQSKKNPSLSLASYFAVSRMKN